WLMIGMMVRVIRFQSAFSLIGITGWTLRIQTISSLLPAPKLKLFWKGTLMRSATGFCVFLASSVSLSWLAEVAACCVLAALTSSNAAISTASVRSPIVNDRERVLADLAVFINFVSCVLV